MLDYAQYVFLALMLLFAVRLVVGSRAGERPAPRSRQA
jgi:hypothetical protein